MFLKWLFFFPAFGQPPCLAIPGGAFISEDDRCTVWRFALSRLLFLWLWTICHLVAFLAAVETKDGLLGLLYRWRIDSCGAAVRASLRLQNLCYTQARTNRPTTFASPWTCRPFRRLYRSFPYSGHRSLPAKHSTYSREGRSAPAFRNTRRSPRRLSLARATPRHLPF